MQSKFEYSMQREKKLANDKHECECPKIRIVLFIRSMCISSFNLEEERRTFVFFQFGDISFVKLMILRVQYNGLESVRLKRAK